MCAFANLDSTDLAYPLHLAAKVRHINFACRGLSAALCKGYGGREPQDLAKEHEPPVDTLTNINGTVGHGSNNVRS
jgi:hypothetical protein